MLGHEWIRIELIRELRENEGVATGFHGTSGNKAKSIEESGFRNSTCVEGKFGVHFHAEGYGDNAHVHGAHKALAEGDKSYAIIVGKLTNPLPDYNGRPQWVVQAENITILNVTYYPIEA